MTPDHILKSAEAYFKKTQKRPERDELKAFLAGFTEQALLISQLNRIAHGACQQTDFFAESVEPPAPGEIERRISRLLGLLHPLRTLKIVYGTGPRLPALDNLRKTKPRHLLAKIYDPYVAEMHTLARIPSRTKRAAVWQILESLSSRLEFLTSKLLHAYAFRPAYFQASKQPLYRQKRLKTKSKLRTLWIPRPTIRVIQRTLLATFLQPLMAGLPASVYGCRQGRNFNTFEMQHCHIGQQWFVSLDVQDFFPSISTNMVYRWLSTQAPDTLRASFQQALLRKNIDAAEIRWEPDLCLLLSKLFTWQGQLPQGAPSSPALASLVFSPFDDQITQEVEREFGAGVVYTRYFDDLTISLSVERVRSLLRRGYSLKTFKQRVIDGVQKVLKGSGFRLNHKKSRSGDSNSGFLVLGMRLYGDENEGASLVNLSRRKIRKIRSLSHNLQGRGLIRTALNLVTDVEVASTPLKAPRKNHIALAARMVLTICKSNLVIDDLRSMSTATPAIQGVSCRDTLRRVIGYYIRGEVRIVKAAGGVKVTALDGSDQLQLSGDESLAILCLPPKQFTRCLLLWLRCRGLLAYLNSARPFLPPFTYLKTHADLLASSLESLKSGNPKVSESRGIVVGSQSGSLAFSFHEEISEDLKSLTTAVNSWVDRHGLTSKQIHLEWDQSRPTDVPNVFGFFQTLLTYLKSFGHRPRTKDLDYFEVFELLTDCLGKRRLPHYKAVDKFFEHSSARRPFEEWKVSTGKEVLTNIVQNLRQLYLDDLGLEVFQSETIDSRIDNLISHLWATREKLKREYSLFQELLPGSSAKPDCEILNSLSKTCQSWPDLWDLGYYLDSLLVERLNEVPKAKHALKQFVESMRVAKLLRHRHSHQSVARSDDSVENWVDVQRWAAKALGRAEKFAPSASGQLYGDDDLKITDLEARILQEELLRRAREALDRLDKAAKGWSDRSNP